MNSPQADKVIRIACVGLRSVDLSELQPFQGDLKSLSPEAQAQLEGQIRVHGFSFPIAVWPLKIGSRETLFILDGHQRLRVLIALREQGWTIPLIPITTTEADSYEEAKAKLLAAASQFGKVENQGLFEFLRDSKLDLSVLDSVRLPEISLPEFKHVFFDHALPSPDTEPTNSGALATRFLVPPFSVLDARQGYWQDRKREWMALGIQSEVGRGDNLLKMSPTVMLKRRDMSASMTSQNALNAMTGQSHKTGTSIFDPVLCELAYRWFCPKGGTVLDPFAGGSVRGIVAAKLGLYYYGCELRQEQVDANTAQLPLVNGYPAPVWICTDSRQINTAAAAVKADLVFSCPPYADLEVYSEDPRDLSNMAYEKFREAYQEIIAKSVDLLKPDRFAVFVVGEVREKDRQGFYRGFVHDTIQAFENAGARFYNEAILVTAVGTLPLRVPKIFSASRKLGKTHQNVLIFCKGDPQAAVQACGEVEITDISGLVTEDPGLAEENGA